ncbi:MAG TPA: hypothetical protein VGM84_12005 [Steroidobacteraceae bacterium]
MINKRTVFVLGAGANVPYGFSTGGGLIDKARGIDPRELMGNAGDQIRRIESDAFRRAAFDNLLPSIDSMLEHRPDLAKVGKWVMATLLYRQEATAAPRSFEEDWMSLVFAYMSEDASTLEEFAQNPVSFITFNYDRYLEHRFIRGLVARYSVSPREAWAKIATMFIHLYGSLGDLPEQVPEGQETHAVPLGAPDTDDVYTLGLALPKAENSIRIVYDSEQPPDSFTDAWKRFQTSQQVLFLGFGFGKKNVARLRTNAIPNSVTIDCTTYEMTKAEVLDLVLSSFPGRDLGAVRRRDKPDTTSVRIFLRERVDWFR